MADDHAISDERIAQVLGLYARMANRVIGDPVRWLGLDDDPPPSAPLPAQGPRRAAGPRVRRGDARVARRGPSDRSSSGPGGGSAGSA